MLESTALEEVIKTAGQYYLSMVAGDEQAIRRLFEPRAAIVGHFQGEFLWQDVDAFIAEAASFVGKHGVEEYRIETVRVDGDIAFASVAGRYAELWIVDHLDMVRISGRWTIIGKTYHVLT